jgi:hypothetical protein
MNKVVFEVTRSYVDTLVGATLTDVQWSAISSEITDFLEYYTADELPRLFADIDSIVAEHGGK